MKERPNLFSAPMVRALLDGRKTQTRRVAKWLEHQIESPDVTDGVACLRADTGPSWVKCPYGQPGDRLWVRETWKRYKKAVGEGQSYHVAEFLAYKADDVKGFDRPSEWYEGPWKPSIHMFQKDSRLTLEVTGVRVERLQDISEEDAKAEGAFAFVKRDKGLHSYVDDYKILWESINGPGSWDANPWVWVVEFKRVTP